METYMAVRTLSALAHEGRLSVFRALVKAGPGGMAAGDIARQLKTAANTMSAQLMMLSNAGLIHARRDGRSIIYAVDFEQMSGLLLFLTEDCCGGRAEICAPLAAVATSCCPPKRRQRA
ncbi:MAG: metalloregulator ArsR/SmtB family transcription factor [Alphaproteobacteria bacterium]|nr:metalloregulator ArsR/SmtB family transcription factor [Alphaproteobacteria bacterium]